jgi:hypothetical protein
MDNEIQRRSGLELGTPAQIWVQVLFTGGLVGEQC